MAKDLGLKGNDIDYILSIDIDLNIKSWHMMSFGELRGVFMSCKNQQALRWSINIIMIQDRLTPSEQTLKAMILASCSQNRE